jgi:hypothetical protein
MSLATEEARAEAWRASRRNRKAAERERARNRRGDPSLRATLQEQWRPLIDSENDVERQP